MNDLPMSDAERLFGWFFLIFFALVGVVGLGVEVFG